jgi:hypothetical protein
MWLRLSLLTSPLLLTGCAGQPIEAQLPPDPTPEAYIAASGGHAVLVAAGQYALDGRPMNCAKRPTVLDPDLNDYAIAYPRLIVVNPSLMEKTSSPVKVWIYEHECGHVVHGWNQGKGANRADTARADCYGIKKGLREGWLNAKGLDRICEFISAGRADAMHASGPERCAAMRQCYARAAGSASTR